MPRKLLIVFMGEKGPGLIFAKELYQVFKSKSEYDTNLLLGTRNHKNEADANSFYLAIPHSIKDLLSKNSFRIDKYFTNVLTLCKLRKQNFNQIIFTMSSPSNHFIRRVLKKNRTSIVNIIHDTVKHSGDNWPTKRSVMNDLSKSEKLVFLSKFTFAESMKITREVESKSVILQHPKLYTHNKEEFAKSTNKYFLIIGRVRKYKGIEEFLGIWENRTSYKDYKLKIVGEGKLYIDKNLPNDVEFTNQWVEEESFKEHIANSFCVVLPYLEATQSGVLVTAMQYKKRIITTNKGALLDQLLGYKTKVIVDEITQLRIDEDLENELNQMALFEEKNSQIYSFEEFTENLHKFLER